MLTKAAKESMYRNLEENFRRYFTKDLDLACCTDIKETASIH